MVRSQDESRKSLSLVRRRSPRVGRTPAWGRGRGRSCTAQTPTSPTPTPLQLDRRPNPINTLLLLLIITTNHDFFVHQLTKEAASTQHYARPAVAVSMPWCAPMLMCALDADAVPRLHPRSLAIAGADPPCVSHEEGIPSRELVEVVLLKVRKKRENEVRMLCGCIGSIYVEGILRRNEGAEVGGECIHSAPTASSSLDADADALTYSSLSTLVSSNIQHRDHTILGFVLA